MKDNSTLSQKALNGVFWKFAEKFSGQLMQLIIQIVLARILLPSEYGLVGLLSIFITISDVFIIQGFTTALIQKKDPDEVDYSSVFFANIIMAIVLYAILYAIAPLLASFYSEPQLKNVMRVMANNVVVGALGAVHNAILSRNLDFKKSFMRNISNSLTQGIVGITMALHGFGVWSMVISKVSGTLVGVIVLWFSVRWQPQFIFSGKRVKSLFKYSSKVLGTNLLNAIFNNIHSLIIGRYYSTIDVGYFQRGQQIPQATMASVDGSMSEVLYPTFSKLQQNYGHLKAALRKSIKTSMFIVLPLMGGLCITAEPITLLLLTDKWLPSVPYMQIQCLICMLWPLSHRIHALNAIGKSDISFRVSVIEKSITVLAIVVLIPLGIYTVMIGAFVSSIICSFITSYYIKLYLDYSFTELVKDLSHSVLLTMIMCLLVSSVNLLDPPVVITLIVQIILGVAVYIAGAWITKHEVFLYLLEILKNQIIRK